MQVAIIDLGTNTFNLLIAEVVGESYKILLETKYPAKLGKGGINNATITEEAFERGLVALRKHLDTIQEYDVSRVNCFATAAIRGASNGGEFVERVKEELGLVVEVIQGDAEAQLIFDGVKQVIPMNDEKVLILDIGGGSNEFIIANKEKVFWKHSFNLGVARLLDRFNPSDPITEVEIKNVEAYLRPELQLLFEAIKEYPVKTLIGSSGSFDTIAKMIAVEHHPFLAMSQLTSFEIKLARFMELHERFLFSTHEERSKMKGLDLHRVEMIVLASIFINLIICELGIERIYQCAFALKEGAIFQLLNE